MPLEELDVGDAVPPLQGCAEPDGGEAGADAGKLAVVGAHLILESHLERPRFLARNELFYASAVAATAKSSSYS